MKNLNINKNLLFKVTDEDIIEKLKENPNSKFYLGIDPTGEGIHIGHLIPIRLAIELLQNGFHGFLLIGGFTGSIGDPTDKSETRKKLNEDSTNMYSKIIFDDINRIFEPYKDKIIFVNNKDWLDKLSFSDFLNISYHVSINRKISLETFSNRLKENLNLSSAEFMYPDMQMIDFLHLFNNFGCNIQIGGCDQWGNVSYGTHYVRKITQNKNIYGLCTPLLVANGKKISKSEGKPPFIKDPFSIYQHCIRVSDDTLIQLRDIFLPDFNLSENHKENREIIAKEVLKISYPNNYNALLNKIKEDSENIFYKDIDEIPEDLLTEYNLNENLDIISIINNLDNSISKSEIKRKLSENAITINNEKTNENKYLSNGKYKIKIGSKIVFCIYIK